MSDILKIGELTFIPFHISPEHSVWHRRIRGGGYLKIKHNAVEGAQARRWGEPIYEDAGWYAEIQWYDSNKRPFVRSEIRKSAAKALQNLWSKLNTECTATINVLRALHKRYPRKEI